MSQKRVRSASPAAATRIFKSFSIEDRASKFVAYYSPNLTAKELQAQTEIETATHRIAAWRRPSSQRALGPQRLFDMGHDDDGEKYGGRALETVMATMNVEGAVVVARWYGGVMLGPVRFDHMRACAREAISGWMQANDRAAKRSRVQAEGETKERLLRLLPERDQSLTVLRELLAEKKQLSSRGDSGKSTPAKVPDYSNLPLPTLEKLEQVRDASIGWILKEIENAELAQQNESNQNSAAADTAKSKVPDEAVEALEEWTDSRPGGSTDQET
ncbi:hypothetical protein MMC08_008264 [Hypocenomyce scalaris]|nr:hypothetical protein [Hypocenomyce scalaris]